MSDDMQTVCEALGMEVPAGELDAAGLVFAQHLVVIDGMMCCSVTMMQFEDPVITADGFQIERSAIEDWFAEGHTTSCRTLEVLEDLELTPSPMCRVMRALFVDGGTLLAAPDRVDTTEALFGRHIAAMTRALSCPITLELLENPIMTSDGHAYEYTALLDWLKQDNKTSPLTGLVLTRRVIWVNRLALVLLRVLGNAKAELERLKRARIHTD